MLMKRSFQNLVCRSLKLLLLTALPAIAVPSMAATPDYPNRPVRVLIPFAPGGGSDIAARLVGNKLSERMGQPLIIDNRAAAGGVLARNLAAQANPDGYTLLVLSGSQVIGAALVQNKPVDMRNVFAGVTTLSAYPYVLTTNPSLPIKSVKDLIAHAKANPGSLNYGSTGVGSEAHLASELFNHMAGTRMIHIPYKGAGPGLLDLIGGRIQMLFSSSSSAMPHIKTGRVRLLATSTLKRPSTIADVPTVAESGLPGFDVTGWYGIVAPAKTPGAVISQLNREIGATLALPDIQSAMKSSGTDPWYLSPAEFTRMVEETERKWRKLAQSAKLVLE